MSGSIGRLALAIAACVAACLLAVAHAGPDDAAAGEMKEVSSEDGRFSISFPSAWEPVSEKPGDAVMAWRIEVPDGVGRIHVGVHHLVGMLNPRAQPYMERDGQVKSHGSDPAHIEMTPIPHMWVDYPAGAPTSRRVLLFHVVRRNGFTVTVDDLEPSLWPKIRDDVIRAAQSVKTTEPEWPPPPDGFRRVAKDQYVYHLHKAIKDTDVKSVHEIVRAQQALFEKLHGPIPYTAEVPLMLVMCPTKEEAGKVDPGAARTGGWALVRSDRLLFVPPAKGDLDALAGFVNPLWLCFEAQAFGQIVPEWFRHGEAVAAAAEAIVGKPLPVLPESYAKVMPGSSVKSFEETAAIKEVNDSNLTTTFAWVAFFRAGPKKYQDVWAAFLKDVHATGDFETATKQHLLSLDQDDLRKAAVAFLAKGLKPVKGR